jgi:hypothetical protein
LIRTLLRVATPAAMVEEPICLPSIKKTTEPVGTPSAEERVAVRVKLESAGPA